MAAIEEEARNIIREAERRAEEILAKARKDAEELLKKEVRVQLPPELIRNVEEEFMSKLLDVRRVHEVRVSVLKERYSKVKEEVVDEYLRLVLGM